MRGETLKWLKDFWVKVTVPVPCCLANDLAHLGQEIRRDESGERRFRVQDPGSLLKK
jgi:hypothetical protein